MSDLFPWFCDLTREYAKDLTFASAAASEEALFTAGDPAHASVQRVPEKFDAPSSKERRSLFQPIPAGASEASSLPASNAPSSASQRRKVPDAVNESGRGASIQLSRGEG